jgi:hypothetical protein
MLSASPVVRSISLHSSTKADPRNYFSGDEVKAEELHDDCLGTALEALCEAGVTELFSQIAPPRRLDVTGLTSVCSTRPPSAFTAVLEGSDPELLN